MSEIVGKVLGYYLYLHIKQMAHMSDGTAAYHLYTVPCVYL